ncbi:hypothetical protein CDAR_510901 [Caerostris darwini]|uniref:Uncharacterized protein n=1 Tax=Caerostris darwini TaxID=1538125 RepID=A0AAV4TEF2_9ARAC|nr:hypothetical protein CDAR_510901 [Caerostris darwini]
MGSTVLPTEFQYEQPHFKPHFHTKKCAFRPFPCVFLTFPWFGKGCSGFCVSRNSVGRPPKWKGHNEMEKGGCVKVSAEYRSMLQPEHRIWKKNSVTTKVALCLHMQSNKSQLVSYFLPDNNNANVENEINFFIIP